MTTTDFETVDYFRARDLWKDPYPYFEWLRAHGPVWREPHHGVVMVTGFEEAMSVYNNHAVFSSCNTVAGPWAQWPVPIEGDDISEIIEKFRDGLMFSDQLPSFDPPRHTEHRGLLMRLITPKRLKENEEFMWRLADRQIDEFLARGQCEFVADYANPFTLFVIADLLGVPEEDHDGLREELQGDARPTQQKGTMAHKPLEFLYDRFRRYIEDRRRAPRADVMTELATATFPDGTLPPVDDIMLISANLFAAGGETTARLLTTMVRYLGERPELQQQVRANRELIPALVEETLRLETPLHAQFRLARVNTTVGGIDFPAGTTFMMLNGAANHDPRQFDAPDELRLDRVNGRHHIGFGFGIHTCAGAPLARAEARISFERILDRMDDITISEAHHGPAGARRYDFAPIYLLRGVDELHIEFDMSDRFRAELRAWLAEHVPPAIEVAATPEEAEEMRAWQRTLHADGWVGVHWPPEFGGRGATPAETAIYNEELARAGAPPLLGRVGISLVGPTLMPHGTDEQRARWMPRILNGDDVWCQLFSEPDAGSDLAGLATRAEKRNDTYIVNGQKVWSSYARFANWGIALVRTDPDASPSRGISMLAIPMDAPGVDVRPLRQITGEAEFNEVFLDDVVVPADHLIGPEHEGWRVANTTLANERGASFIWREQVLHELAMERLIDACRKHGTDPVLRQRLAQSWIEVEIFRLHNARTLTRLARGDELGAESSIVKLFWANLSPRLYDTAFSALAPNADDEWVLGMLASRATSIMGGTSEIQRNIIGERILGLPREPK